MLIVNGITALSKLVSIGAHRGKKKHDLLLMMFYIGAESQVLGEEYNDLGWGRQAVWLEELVAKHQQQRIRPVHAAMRLACS